MIRNAPVEELLLRWEDLLAQGQVLSTAELCRDCPEHQEELARRLRALQAMHHVLASPDTGPDLQPVASALEQTYKDLEQHYQQAIERDPTEHGNWYCVATLRLQRGDVEGYYQVCRKMLTRFSQTDKPEIANRTAKICLLRPGAGLRRTCKEQKNLSQRL